MFCHVIYNLLHRHVHIVLNDSLINVSNHTLNYSELLEKFSAGIEYLLREYVLFTIDPEVGEALLGRIKYFSEIAQGALFVEDLVGL
jgi:hypothetical protein